MEVLVPDPLKAKEREEGKRQEKEGRDEKVKGGGEGRGPAGGLVDDREKILVFLQPLGPGIRMSLSRRPGRHRVAAAASLD